MGNTFYADFFADDEFQDFFEHFIIFTNNVKIKNEEDFEDDLFDINAYNEDHLEIDSLSDFEEYLENYNTSESETESESESESDSDSD